MKPDLLRLMQESIKCQLRMVRAEERAASLEEALETALKAMTDYMDPGHPAFDSVRAALTKAREESL